jgi:hypothetical protein
MTFVCHIFNLILEIMLFCFLPLLLLLLLLLLLMKQ